MTDTVYVHITDSKVWNPMIAAAEIMVALQNHETVTIDLKNESPALDHTELPMFLDHLSRTGIDVRRIRIVTGNILEDFKGPVVVKTPKSMYELAQIQKVVDTIPKDKYIRCHFGNFISRCNTPRLVIASHLYCNYREKTVQTFHWDPANDYHKIHLGFEEFVHLYGTGSVEFQEAISLIQAAPVLINKVASYPIFFPEHYLEPCRWYRDFFVDIVCETWYQGNNFFLTEKFWRSVITKTPFILFGATNILANLHKLGFRTFSEWWDEGYSQDPFAHNIFEIKKVIAKISQYSIKDLEIMYQEMQTTLDHNLEVFRNLTYEDFHKIS